MDWDDVRHFLALARSGSIRAAGASLGVSHSTVARRVDGLEARLAARLFDRSRDGYTLTEAGLQMLASAERIEHEMAALERGLVGQDERLCGEVALTCCDNYLADLLLRELTRFCHAYPEVELCFTVDSRPFDLSKREADVAIRALARGAQPPEHLIGMRLAPVTLASYVATAHAESLAPEHDGTAPRWVSFDDRKMQDAMIADSSYRHIPVWGSFSTFELLVRAACEGLGLVMLPTYVGDREPALRRLARPDLRHMGDLWLLSHPDLRDNARLRAIRAFIADAMRRHAGLFAGEGWCTDAPGRSEIASDGPARAP